jgi:hypothetical protein
MEKQKVQLSCTLSKPKLNVQWFKDGEEITNDGKFKFVQEGKVYKLLIDNASLEDKGVYKLKYKDELETSCELSIQGPCLYIIIFLTLIKNLKYY